MSGTRLAMIRMTSAREAMKVSRKVVKTNRANLLAGDVAGGVMGNIIAAYYTPLRGAVHSGDLYATIGTRYHLCLRLG